MRQNKKFYLIVFQIVILSTLIFGNLSITLGSIANNNGIILGNNILDEDFTTLAAPQLLWVHDLGLSIEGVAISDDGQYIVAGEFDGNLTLFNKTGGTIWSYKIDSIRSVDMSADGFYVIVGCANGNLSLYNRTNGHMWHYNTSSSIYEAAISADGNYMVSCDSAGNLTVFNKTKGYMWNYTYSPVEFPIRVAISQDGMYIAAGLDGVGNVSLHNISCSTEYMWSYNFPHDHVYGLDISLDGNYIVSANNDDCNVSFFTRTGGYVWNYEKDTQFWDVAISGDGNYFVSADSDGDVTFFDRNGYIGEYDTGSSMVRCVDASKDGKYFVSGDQDHYITIFTLNHYVSNYIVGAPVLDLAISADGQYIVGGINDGNVYLLYNELPSPSGINPLLLLLLQPTEIDLVVVIAIVTIIAAGVCIFLFIILKTDILKRS